MNNRARWCELRAALLTLCVAAAARPVVAQGTGGTITGQVRDQTGGALPGVLVELGPGDRPTAAETDAGGQYRLDAVPPGSYTISFRLLNFSELRRSITVADGQTIRVDGVLSLALNADVVVTGKRTFVNLADADNPAENLIGIAQSASQGAITARQLEVRPVLRAGEVLETVPGVIITQHSGEGKANQYFLRGFNLDHGSDFATTIAGIPVNMPTHAHSQGYSDINFLMPELVAGVQFSKGPYFAEQGDFATAGASNITYATALDRPLATLEIGGFSYSRLFAAVSPALGSGHLLAAAEISTNDGPWHVPDAYHKYNGVLRYSRGDAVNGFTLTAMGYHGTWNATEASPLRAIKSGLIDRFGTIDPTDGGETYRYSASAEWQHGSATTVTRIGAFGLVYDLHLASNFTFYLDDPVHGDQQEQVDHRFTSGARASHRRVTRWAGREVQTTVGVQVRNDSIPTVALYHTEARQRLEVRSDSSARVTSLGGYGQGDIEWSRWLRLSAGIRADGSWYQVTALDPANSGTASAGRVSPKVGATFGPWHGTEFYANAGIGFHSNSALGTTITRAPDGTPAERVTPLVGANGSEIGVRTVVIPHLQSTASLWRLHLDSELVYNGDAGATEPGPASNRHGLEIANYYSPVRWLTFDADVSLSRARFADAEPGHDYVPEAVETVVSAGVSVDGFHRVLGSLRWRYFGPRALVDDNSVRSEPTSLVNLQAGYQLSKRLRVVADVFNLFDAQVSDIDYYFTSRLPGEPLNGVDDIHFHPAVPRTVRVGATISF